MRSRSPWATAAMARVTSVVGQSRSSISELTEASISPQAPSDKPRRTRCRVLPSRPTTWPTRSTCLAMRWLVATISLKVSAILPMIPMRSPAMRTEKSPTRIACSACSSSVSPWASPFSPFSVAWGIACGTDEPLAAAGMGAAGSSTSVGVCMKVSETRYERSLRRVLSERRQVGSAERDTGRGSRISTAGTAHN